MKKLFKFLSINILMNIISPSFLMKETNQPTEELAQIIDKIKKVKNNLDFYSINYDKCLDATQQKIKSIWYSLRNDIIGSSLSQFSEIYEIIMKVDEQEHFTVILYKMTELLNMCAFGFEMDDEINKCHTKIHKTVINLIGILHKNDDPTLGNMDIMLMFEDEIVMYRKQYIEAYKAYQQTLKLQKENQEIC